MNTFFEQSRSHWVRYERYEIKTGKDGKKYITPAKDARPDVYNPLKEAPDIVLDALNVGMLMMNGKKSSEPGRKGNLGIYYPLWAAGPDDGPAHHAVLYGL